jgi:putative ABC transport system substrate-binding protein
LPISIPNSTARRSAFQRAFSETMGGNAYPSGYLLRGAGRAKTLMFGERDEIIGVIEYGPTIADELISMTRREVLLLSAAMTVPRLVLAQQMESSPVGILDPIYGPRQSTLAALREGLEDAAYKSLMPLEYRRAGWTDDRFDPLLTLAIDLVICGVGVIVTGNLNGIRAAKAATSSIPIVFFAGRDVIEAGLIESADRPGGNLTGIVIPSEGHLKQLDLLTKLLPKARGIAFLVNPNSKAAETQIQEMQEAARSIGIELKILRASAEGDFEADFADLANLHVDGLVVSADPSFDSWRQQLVSFAARYAIPAIYGWPEFTDVGGLISYGPSRTAIWRQAGLYAGKILKGAKPVDLPVQKPKRVELVVNLKTAKALALTVPQSILDRADEVIE